MIEETFLKLQHSEGVVSNMAAQILSGFIASGQWTEANENDLINRSLIMALKLAQRADALIDSDDESKEK